jgi:hypothetical protein
MFTKINGHFEWKNLFIENKNSNDTALLEKKYFKYYQSCIEHAEHYNNPNWVIQGKGNGLYASLIVSAFSVFQMTTLIVKQSAQNW